MNPFVDEPTRAECVAISQWGRLGLIWRCFRAAWARRQLERRILEVYMQFAVANTPETQRKLFDRMRDLIAQRSSVQVERMERERGLRA